MRLRTGVGHPDPRHLRPQHREAITNYRKFHSPKSPWSLEVFVPMFTSPHSNNNNAIRISQNRDAFYNRQPPKVVKDPYIRTVTGSDCAIMSLATALRRGIQVVLAPGRLSHDAFRFSIIADPNSNCAMSIFPTTDAFMQWARIEKSIPGADVRSLGWRLRAIDVFVPRLKPHQMSFTGLTTITLMWMYLFGGIVNNSVLSMGQLYLTREYVA